jgi:hypothetical protein
MTHIQPLASALSKSFTSNYFPINHSSNKQHTTTKIHQTSSDKFIIKDPFKILLPSSNLNQQYNFLTDYLHPLSIIISYSNGILITNSSLNNNNNNNNVILSYDYTSFKLNKIIKLRFITSNIIFMNNINNKILLLTDDKKLYLIDPLSGILLDFKLLSYNFTHFREIINLNTNNTNDRFIGFLYTNGCYCQLIELNFKNFKISIYSSLIQLEFWPISILSIDNTFFYIFNSLGNYQLLIKNSIHEILSFSISNTNYTNLTLIDKKYGKLIEIQYFNDNFIFLQENGWLIYQFNKNLKLNNSLNNLILLISSPLYSRFDKLIQLDKNKSFILMDNRDLILILNNNNIQPINPLNNGILDILLDHENNRIIGFYNPRGINYLDENNNWNTIYINSIKSPLNSYKVIYQDKDLKILCDSKRLILKNKNDLELCSLFGFNAQHIKIINLNLFIGLPDHMKYFIIMDCFGKFQLLTLNEDLTLLLGTFNIFDKTTNIYYYDSENILQFNSSKFINLLTFEISNYKPSLKSPKFLIYKVSDEYDYDDDEDHTEMEFFNDMMPIISFDDLSQYNELFKNDSWIGIKTFEQTIFYKYDANLLHQSPEIFLIYTILNKSVDLKIISQISQLDQKHILNYVKSISKFCISNNSLIIETSINILYSILSNHLEILDILIKDCIEFEFDSLYSAILIVICISVDKKLIDLHKSLMNSIFDNIINYLTILNSKVCGIFIDVLMKLDINNYKFEENYDIIWFFNKIFEIRSLFFNDLKLRNFKCFSKCTEFFNFIINQNIYEGFVIMCTIIEHPSYEIDNKKNVIDYINYLLLEKVDLLKENNNFKMILLILINSIFSMLSNISIGLLNEEFWESINLSLNVLSNGFTDYFSIDYHDNWKAVVDNKKNCSACLLIDEFGYYGVIYNKEIDTGWYIIPIKSSQTNIPKFNHDITNAEIFVIENIKKQLKNTNTVVKIKDPILLNESNTLALINMNRLTVQIWHFRKNNVHDNISVEVLKNNSIPLKIPDFNLIFLQYLWSKLNTHDQYDSFKVDFNTNFINVVTDFQEITAKKNTTSPKKDSNRKNQSPTLLNIGQNFSELTDVSEICGEYEFALLLQEYINVFPDISSNSVSIIASTESNDQIELLLNGKAIFVWTL